jgi:hypothetical protein
MDPFDDRELSRLLREWKAPEAPTTLDQGMRRGGPSASAAAAADKSGPPDGPPLPWWRWLFAGTIRVPVPIAVAVALLLAVWAHTRLPGTAPLTEAEPTVSLADFEPVPQLEPRVVGEFK